MKIEEVEGDLLDQKVEAIVNAWNRNIIPWWLLLPHGVSGAIKKRGGLEPFRQIGRTGPLPLGAARLTGAGTLPFKGIIHVAGIDGFWRASEKSIRGSVRSAMAIVNEHGFSSAAFPVIGAGAGSFSMGRSLEIMRDEFASLSSSARVIVVTWKKP
jgi:O-acetyl-ADP-ribose deacetylase (regulator of RNase III)